LIYASHISTENENLRWILKTENEENITLFEEDFGFGG
jgi:hypothetical protein